MAAPPVWLSIAGLVAGKHPAGADIRRFNGHEVFAGQKAATLFEQAAGLTQTRAIQSIANGACIGEMWLLYSPRDVLQQYRIGLRAQAILHLLQHEACNRLQLLREVVREVNVMRNPRG